MQLLINKKTKEIIFLNNLYWLNGYSIYEGISFEIKHNEYIIIIDANIYDILNIKLISKLKKL